MGAVRHSPPRAPAAPATPGNPQHERPVHEFPAQQLDKVLRECRALPGLFISDPPPSIERLSADELSLLEGTLRPRLMHAPAAGPAPLSREARHTVHAWVLVQSERLRRPGNAHDAALPPEHAAVVNDFLQILHPAMGLPQNLRTHLRVAFNRQSMERRIPPQVDVAVGDLGLHTLAARGYRLDARTGAFTPAIERELGRVLELSRAPRSRTGKLPDSEQYRHIKSMTPDERTWLEGRLETQFMNQAVPPPSENALQALDAWLTTQQVRLRVHSEASIQRHAQVLGSSPVTGPDADRAREVARFRGEHASSDRPEYAIALNNFLRLLHPDKPLSADLKQRIAERLTHHAEIEGTLSAPVVEALRQHDPHALAAGGWQLYTADNVFSPLLVAVGPRSVQWWAHPTPYTPASPTGIGQADPELRG
jgi:hypothetical protein